MKKIRFYILIISFFNYTGCYSPKTITKEILYAEDHEGSMGAITIITNEAKRIELFEGTYQVIDDTLYAKGLMKTNVNDYNQPVDVKIALADIQYAEIEEHDALATSGCVIGLAGLVLLIVGVIAIGISMDNSPRSCEVGK